MEGGPPDSVATASFLLAGYFPLGIDAKGRRGGKSSHASFVPLHF